MRFLNYCLVLFLLNTALLLGQEVVLEIKINETSKRTKKRTYSFSNSLNNDLAVLIREKKNVFAYLFDQDFKIKSQFEFESSKKKKYNTLLGETINGEKYSLFYANKSYTKFCVFTFDFSLKTGHLKEFDFYFEDEIYLKTISHNNKLYVLSSGLKNELIIRKLNNNYELEIVKRQTLELDKKQKLHYTDFAHSAFWSKKKSNLTKIDNRVPNAIEQASEDNKIYVHGNNLYLTFDNKTASTLMFIINMSNFSVERKEFAYPKGKLDDFKKKNSYFVDNVLFQIASSNKEMALIAKTLDGTVLNSYYFDKETPINIKNSTITQEGATALPFVTKREFEETSKFLRKISSGKIGLSAYKKDGEYHFTIGGVKKLIRSHTPIMMPMSSSITLPNNSQITVLDYNPVYFGYQSYTSSKSTYFNTKFDLNFKYIKAEVRSNVYEKIETFKENLKHTSGEDMFYHKDQLLYGYFNLKAQKFNLVEF